MGSGEQRRGASRSGISDPSDVAPTGRQHTITFADHVAVITEVGATLRSYEVGGLEILDGFSADESASAGRGQVLAPWPNRLASGHYVFDGIEGRAALDEPERGNAIHGLVRWLPWSVASMTGNGVTLVTLLDPQPAYPWSLELTVEYGLSADGLTVRAGGQNPSDRTAPFGLGFHPYVTVGAPIEDAWLTIPAARRLVTDDRALPVGEQAVVRTEFDFRNGRQIGATALDTCYTDLALDADGRWRVRMESAVGDRAVEVWADDAFGYVMAYTGDTVEPAARRRRSIAIEPMTCPPNALATGTDVIALPPDTTWQASWGIVPRNRI